MGKHEIRLRRQQMTSRRIERHKNYAQLMNRHHKSQRTKRLVQWLILAFVIILGMMTVYYATDKNKKQETKPTTIETQVPSAI